VVGLEWLGGGAAADGVEQRRFDLEEAARVEESPERLDHLCPSAEHLGDGGIGEEVHVALAVALLDIFEAVPLGGRRQQGFAEVLVAPRADRQGARLGADGRAFHQHVVGEIEELELRGVALRQAVRSNQRLRIAVRGADHEEGAALRDHAPEEWKVRGVGGELVLEGQLGARVFIGGEEDHLAALALELRRRPKGVRVGQDAELPQALCFVLSFPRSSAGRFR
jgi:hypothetical protein